MRGSEGPPGISLGHMGWAVKSLENFEVIVSRIGVH